MGELGVGRGGGGGVRGEEDGGAGSDRDEGGRGELGVERGGVQRSGGGEDADGVTGSGKGGGRSWLLDVYNHALLASPQCIVRDEYTERESGTSLGQRAVNCGEQRLHDWAPVG